MCTKQKTVDWTLAFGPAGAMVPSFSFEHDLDVLAFCSRLGFVAPALLTIKSLNPVGTEHIALGPEALPYLWSFDALLSYFDMLSQSLVMSECSSSAELSLSVQHFPSTLPHLHMLGNLPWCLGMVVGV